MTIQFIDHALNAVLTGLLYGSEAWIVTAFGLYVATHELPQENFSATEAVASSTKTATAAVEDAATGRRTAEISKTKKAVRKSPVRKSPVRKSPVEKSTVKKSTLEKSPAKQNIIKVAQKIAPPASVPTYLLEPVDITCEPVNWKKWKVSDLRRANIAKTCGVRTRPVGSRRNLSKADLIAQYEQQLKRFTKSSVKRKTSKNARITA